MIEEIVKGHTYRAKKPRNANGFVNDRTIVYIGWDIVQYDGPAVAIGRHYPKIAKGDFVKWAERDVTDELPKDKYAPWPIVNAPDAKSA